MLYKGKQTTTAHVNRLCQSIRFASNAALAYNLTLGEKTYAKIVYKTRHVKSIDFPFFRIKILQNLRK